MKHPVLVAGQLVGHIEHVPLGNLWKAVAYGKPYPPPMFGQKGDALRYVREYGKAMPQ